MAISRGFLDPNLSIVYRDLRITFVGLEPTARSFFRNAQKYNSKGDSKCLHEVVLCLNVYPDLPQRIRNELPGSTRVCLLVEPSVTWPWNGKRHLLDEYEVVLTSYPSAEPPNYYIPWYLGATENVEYISPEAWKKRSETTCLVAANKLSLVTGELYRLRREVLHSGYPLELGGYGWNTSFISRLVKVFGELAINLRTKTEIELGGLNLYFRKLPANVTYRGGVTSKYRFSAKHKYAVVIENSLELITEKVYDAIIFGNIPIYVGPSTAQYEFPEGLVIFAEPTLPSILRGIEDAKSLDHERWLALRAEVLVNLFEKHSMENLLEQLREIVVGRS